MKILVNGSEKELVDAMTWTDDKWIDLTLDLLGNTDALHFDDKTEQYVMTEDEFEFWNEYIVNANADDEKMRTLKEKMEKSDYELMCDILCDEIGEDYSVHHDIHLKVFAQFEEEPLKKEKSEQRKENRQVHTRGIR